jgi:hypothetical protein
VRGKLRHPRLLGIRTDKYPRDVVRERFPSLGSWQRTRQDSEIGPSTVHYYGVFGDADRLLVLVSMNSDVSDSWEREGDSRDYFETYGGKGYALGVNVAVWVMTH